MIVTSLSLKNYRNIATLSLSPCSKVNVIYGDNAQGKTNILEAIWLFTGNSSFRGARQSDLIKFDENITQLKLHFKNKQREQNCLISFSNNISRYTKKEMHLNNVPLKKSSELAGNFYCVVFSPDDLDFVKGSPIHRRKFLDVAISQINPQYMYYLEQYEKILIQRNALLREISEKSQLSDTLYIWNTQLSKIGTIITIYRRDYSLKLQKIAKHIYDGISSNKEEFSVKYISSVFDEDEDIKYDDRFIKYYEDKLIKNTEKDIKKGYTTIGIQRDDLELFVDNISLKTYGSQGQQRSGVLTLKLSESDLLKAVTGESPVILLDDVMSELDLKRQDYILNKVKNRQVFITCCEKQSLYKLENGKIFKVVNGEISEEE